MRNFISQRIFAEISLSSLNFQIPFLKIIIIKLKFVRIYLEYITVKHLLVTGGTGDLELKRASVGSLNVLTDSFNVFLDITVGLFPPKFSITFLSTLFFSLVM